MHVLRKIHPGSVITINVLYMYELDGSVTIGTYTWMPAGPQPPSTPPTRPLLAQTTLPLHPILTTTPKWLLTQMPPLVLLNDNGWSHVYARMRTFVNVHMLALIIEVYVRIPSSLSYPLVLHYSSRVKTGRSIAINVSLIFDLAVTLTLQVKVT